MMDGFRNGSYGWPVKLMLGCIVVVMIVGGLNLPAMLGLGGGQFIAKVGGEELTKEQFVSAFQANLRSIQKRHPGALLSPSEQLHWALLQRDQFVEKMLLEQYSDLLQLGGSETAVKAQLKSFPEFRDASGAFNPEQYTAFFKRSFVSPERLARWIRQDLLYQAFSQALKETEWLLPSERDEQFALLAEQRKAQLVIVPLKPYLEKVQIDDPREVRRYYEKHVQSFLKPTQVGLEYLSFNLCELAAQFEVSEDAIKTYYEANQSTLYQDPERIKFSLMLLPSQKQAHDIRKLLIKDSSRFQQFTRTYSVDSDSDRIARGGKVGWRTVSELSPTLATTLNKLKNGEVSEVLPLGKQYAILLREDYSPASVQPLEKVSGSVKAALQMEQAKKQVQQWTEQGFLDKDLATYANRLQRPLQQVDLQPIEAYREWIGTTGTLSTIFPDPEALEVGQVLPLITRQDQYLMSRVAKIESARPYTLEEIESKLVKLLRIKRAKEEARRELGEWLTELHTGKLTLEQLIQEKELEAPVDYTIRRSDLSSSPHFAALFDWVVPTSNRPVYGLLEDNDRFFLAALVESIPGNYYQEGDDRIALQLYQQLQLQTERALVEFCRGQFKTRYGSKSFLQNLIEHAAAARTSSP